MNIIEVSNISKRYSLREAKPYYTLRDSLGDVFRNPLQILKRKNRDSIWALTDVSFKVPQGEVFGILGNNGAGKSTLLKILGKITLPTKGQVTLHGRLGSLLEVGTGFHPELTGKENIYLYGAILGMSRKEVKGQFEEIVEFADVSQFLDTPLKHYSSGMYMRLAFSVAAHLRCEILLIDEVLAVGDIEFQKKCLGKMGDIAQQGRTILFVSHNMGAIQQLCTSCAVLEKGALTFVGPTQKAVDAYIGRAQSPEHKSLDSRPRKNDATLQAKIQELVLRSGQEVNPSTIDSSKRLTFELSLRAKQTVKTGVWIAVKDESLRPVLLFSSGHQRGKDFDFKKGMHRVKCEVEATHLANGQYTVDCGLLYPNRETVDFIPNATTFTVTHCDPYKVGFDFSQSFASYHVGHTWNVQKSD